VKERERERENAIAYVCSRVCSDRLTAVRVSRTTMSVYDGVVAPLLAIFYARLVIP